MKEVCIEDREHKREGDRERETDGGGEEAEREEKKK